MITSRKLQTTIISDISRNVGYQNNLYSSTVDQPMHRQIKQKGKPMLKKSNWKMSGTLSPKVPSYDNRF